MHYIYISIDLKKKHAMKRKNIRTILDFQGIKKSVHFIIFQIYVKSFFFNYNVIAKLKLKRYI